MILTLDTLFGGHSPEAGDVYNLFAILSGFPVLVPSPLGGEG